jgi:hypothetical protein
MSCLEAGNATPRKNEVQAQIYNATDGSMHQQCQSTSSYQRTMNLLFQRFDYSRTPVLSFSLIASEHFATPHACFDPLPECDHTNNPEAILEAHLFLIPFGFAAGAVIEVTVPSAL